MTFVADNSYYLGNLREIYCLKVASSARIDNFIVFSTTNHVKMLRSRVNFLR